MQVWELHNQLALMTGDPIEVNAGSAVIPNGARYPKVHRDANLYRGMLDTLLQIIKPVILQSPDARTRGRLLRLLFPTYRHNVLIPQGDPSFGWVSFDGNYSHGRGSTPTRKPMQIISAQATFTGFPSKIQLSIRDEYEENLYAEGRDTIISDPFLVTYSGYGLSASTAKNDYGIWVPNGWLMEDLWIHYIAYPQLIGTMAPSAVVEYEEQYWSIALSRALIYCQMDSQELANIDKYMPYILSGYLDNLQREQ